MVSGVVAVEADADSIAGRLRDGPDRHGDG